MKIPTVLLMGLLGVAAFATVAPHFSCGCSKKPEAPDRTSLQFNIAAFNLGNALGAMGGGITIDAGLGFCSTALVAAAITLVGLGVALWSVQPRSQTGFGSRVPATNRESNMQYSQSGRIGP